MRGQALVETAIVIPLMLLLMLGFLALLIRIEAQVELETATSLAAAAAVSAPAGSDASRVDAEETWQGTLHQYSYLQPGDLSAGCGAYTAGADVVCTGTAHLDYGRTAMGIVIPWGAMDLTATATAHSSPYRSS